MKEEQICRTKANSMFTCPPESSSCLGLGRQRDEWTANCVRDAVRSPITPVRRTSSKYGQIPEALPWIIGTGIAVFIIYKFR
jgi:hypothetical protein